MRLSAALFVWATLLATTALAQERDWVAPEIGTGVIRGQVVTADGRPLSRALVRLTTQAAGWGQVVADEQGAFEFTELPVGRYQLFAIAAGYLSRAYGQSRPSGAPRTINLKAGQVRSGIEIALPPGGVIAVRVTDEAGSPVEGAFVQARRPLRSADGELSLPRWSIQSDHNHGTDDRGEIRIYDLEPGHYYVSVSPGFFPGQSSDQESRERTIQAETFFPGVTRLADAEPVALELGQEIVVDVMIANDVSTASRGGAITVHVTDDAGNPRGGVGVRALTIARDGDSRRLTRATLTVSHPLRFGEPREFFTDDRGDARLYGLAAGDYVVVADPPLGRVIDPEGRDHALTYVPTYFPGSPSRADAHVLSIQPWDDVQLDIRLVPSQAARISGRVVRWDGEPGRAYVVLSRNSGVGINPPGLIHDSLIRATLVDGQFQFDDVLPGDYVIRTYYDPDSDVRDGVAEISITLEGEDLSDVILTTVPDRDSK